MRPTEAKRLQKVVDALAKIKAVLEGGKPERALRLTTALHKKLADKVSGAKTAKKKSSTNKYGSFVKAQWAKVSRANPGKTFTQLSKILAKQWKELTDKKGAVAAKPAEKKAVASKKKAAAPKKKKAASPKKKVAAPKK